jgi:hypothetical protein
MNLSIYRTNSNPLLLLAIVSPQGEQRNYTNEYDAKSKLACRLCRSRSQSEIVAADEFVRGYLPTLQFFAILYQIRSTGYRSKTLSALNNGIASTID